VIPSSVELLGLSCFSGCQLLSSITFESNSRLARIESETFSYSSLRSIVIPSNVEILGSKCFYACQSLSSITFELPSRLTRIESEAFLYSSLRSIVIPSTILFLASNAVSTISQISLADGDSSPEFDQWRQMRNNDITVDFQRVVGVGFALPG
jgi:hypothetical protein